MGRRKTNARSLPIIQRTAIDYSGDLGSLYDGCHDQIVGTFHVTCTNPSEELHQTSRCILFNGNEDQNPLKLIDIDEELRLSLLLNFTPKSGISTIVDHLHTIDEYTRILHYTYVHRAEHFSDELKNLPPMNIPKTNATHVITGISWGIDIVVVLQLPPDHHACTLIDLTLEKYETYLNGDRNDFKRTHEDIDSIERILSTNIFSNISTLNNLTSLHDLFHSITRLKLDATDHQPLTYTLSPIQSIYYQPRYLDQSLDPTHSNRLENYLIELVSSVKLLEMYFNEDLQSLLCGHFKAQLFNASIHWAIVNEEYRYTIDHCAKLLVDIRCGRIRPSAIQKKLRLNKKQIDAQTRIDYLIQEVMDLNAKGHLITDLDYQSIEYCNVTEHNINRYDTEMSLKGKLIADENTDRVLCSSDALNKKNPNLVKELRQNLLEELTNNSRSRLVYADFSYCDYPLYQMMILPTNRPQPTTTKLDNSENPLSTMETINILLLGETGVGKSTFINALINYLGFQTLDNAQSNKPMVVIPVSFTTTAEKDSKEYVTQQCQSYTYNLSDTLKLRIIDTPGFGDTRGDDRTVQHIFESLKKFSHLNAVCVLLKPNESRMNVALRSCLTQLFNLFGPDIRENLIFCFTNTRPTFYTPGNTALFLREMFTSLSMPEIPFNRKNVFCFDNESFRYLIDRQNDVSFTDLDRQGYETSWKNSAAESHRLIRYIRKNLPAYPVPDESQVIKYTTIKIAQLTHPMLETMRHILRNIIINKMKTIKQTVGLRAKTEDQNYPRLPYQPILLDFLTDYHIANGPSMPTQDNMIDHLSLFCQISAEFSYFLTHIAHYRNGDPFLIGLSRLIREENEICEDRNRHYMNLQLVDSLQKLTDHYEQHLHTIQSTPTNIYQWIKYLNEYPLKYGYVADTSQTNVEYGNRIFMI